MLDKEIDSANHMLSEFARTIDSDAVFGTDFSCASKRDFVSKNSSEALSLYQKYGFSVLNVHELFSKNLLPLDIFNYIEHEFGLFNRIVPSQYKSCYVSRYYRNSVNLISHKNKIDHASFDNNSEQKIHTDGTLDNLGSINVSVMYCEDHADIFGGETVIFNSVGAFRCLIEHSHRQASYLIEKDCLSKFSPDNACMEVVGPAFSIIEKSIYTRYSDSDLFCRWKNSKKSERALSFMRENLSLYKKNRFSIPLKLERGDVLILRNDKFSHGRRSYIESESGKRRIWRALYK